MGYILSSYHLFQVFITRADLSWTLKINFEYGHKTPDFYVKANFVNQSKPSWRLSEIFIHIKEKFTNEIVTDGSRWAEIV